MNKCPKCGSPKTTFIESTGFECGLEEDGLSYKHTMSCQRISELEAENAKLKGALLLSIVEGRHIFRKGFVEDAGLKALGLSATSEAIQQLQAARASALLEKKGME